MPPFLQKILSYLGINAPTQTNRPQPAPSPATLTTPPADTAADLLQREIRAQRKFSLAEAIGREGGSFMKGESTIPRPLRAIAAINQFIITHISDPAGPLSTTLQTWAKDDIRVSRQLDTPLIALDQIIESLLTAPTTLAEFARQVAIAHSQLTGDRPYFQQLGQPPHPATPYSHAAIRQRLSQLQAILQPSDHN